MTYGIPEADLVQIDERNARFSRRYGLSAEIHAYNRLNMIRAWFWQHTSAPRKDFEDLKRDSEAMSEKLFGKGR